MNYKKLKGGLLVLVVQIVLTLGCQKNSVPEKIPEKTPVSITVAEFPKATVPAQAAYFNSLNATERIHFLSQILPGMTLGVQPDAQILFLPDGDFIFDTDTKARTLGQWKTDMTTLTFRKPLNDKNMDFFKPTETWSDPVAKTDPMAKENGGDSLSFEFKVNGTSETVTVSSLPHDDLQWEEAMKFYNQAKK